MKTFFLYLCFVTSVFATPPLFIQLATLKSTPLYQVPKKDVFTPQESLPQKKSFTLQARFNKQVKINGKWYRDKDKIASFVISFIHKKVFLNDGKKSFELQLFKSRKL